MLHIINFGLVAARVRIIHGISAHSLVNPTDYINIDLELKRESEGMIPLYIATGLGTVLALWYRPRCRDRHQYSLEELHKEG